MGNFAETDLEFLHSYKGTNPKPKDFDKFWKNSINELNNINPNVELIKSEFSTNYADCYDLTFKSVKNTRVYAKLLRPKKIKTKKPAIIIFHGYSGNSGGWVDKPSKLCYVAEGYTVAVLDCRGQGGLSPDNAQRLGWSLRGHIVRGLSDKPKNLMFRDTFLDAVQLCKIIGDMNYVDKNRIGVTGESQGGGLSLAVAALLPYIKKVAPIFPFLCDYKRAWELKTEDSAYIEIEEYIRRFDPTHQNLEKVFTSLGYIDIQHMAHWIKGDVLFATGLCDNRCPPSTQFSVYNKINSNKSIELYPDYGHERLGNHADKIFTFFKDL